MTAIERPTLSQLRARVHKERHQEIGNWLARRWGRPAAVYGTWLAVRLQISANQATLASLVSTALGCASIASGSRVGFVSGVLLLHAAFLFDHVDGQLARWRGKTTLDGVYFDYLMHHFSNMCLGFSLGYGLSARLAEPAWTIAGFLVALGWTFQSLNNDCRYKAMFQRLKSDARSFSIQGGSGGRPAPPAPCPSSAFGAVSWALLKTCEPHVVLTALSVACVLALCIPLFGFGRGKPGLRSPRR